MKVFVAMSGKVYDVEEQVNGDWKFFWTDCGVEQSHTYPAYLTPIHTGSGAWKVIEEVKVPNYAAAFNMWMDSYMNDPQAYEDSHDSAVRHLKEKLNGEEPSYGAVCQEILIKYLEKV